MAVVPVAVPLPAVVADVTVVNEVPAVSAVRVIMPPPPPLAAAVTISELAESALIAAATFVVILLSAVAELPATAPPVPSPWPSSH